MKRSSMARRRRWSAAIMSMMLGTGAAVACGSGERAYEVEGVDASSAVSAAAEAVKDAGGCSGLAPVLRESAFVVLRTPSPGERVAPSFIATGCSSTFEANVVWELRARDGRVLAGDFTTVGSLGAPNQFRIEISYEVEEDQVGEFEIFEPDESDGEGYPSARTVIPVVLTAHGR